MDTCTSCGGRLDDCNESQVVCPWCGEPTAGPGCSMTAVISNLMISIGLGWIGSRHLRPRPEISASAKGGSNPTNRRFRFSTFTSTQISTHLALPQGRKEHLCLIPQSFSSAYPSTLR